jgi:hypothetical protein
MNRSPTKMPPELARLAPKRENFASEEDYEEARAFFIHRIAHLVRRPLPRAKAERKSPEGEDDCDQG